MNKLLFGSKNDDVETPDDLYKELNEEFKFDFDPCPLKASFDGLSIDWGSCNYVNPPFSDVKSWVIKALEQLVKGKKTIMLITARLNSRYWAQYVLPYASEIRVITHRIQFKGFDKPFGPAVVLVIFDPNDLKKRQLIEKRTYSYVVLK